MLTGIPACDHWTEYAKDKKAKGGARKRNDSLTDTAQDWSRAYLRLQLSSPLQLDSDELPEPSSPFPCADSDTQLFYPSLGPSVLEMSR